MADDNVKTKNSGDVDEVSRGIIYDGASISQLSDIFGRDRRTVTKYLREAGVRPSAMRNGYPIYKLREAATYLCDMDPNFIDKRLETMNPQDLPAILMKEYWNGKRARLAYLREDGQLWETERVESMLGLWVKNFLIASRQVVDAVDRQAKMNESQRAALEQQIDELINMTRTSLLSAFASDDDEAVVAPEDENDQL